MDAHNELPGEQWKPVPGFPYQVSSLGRVRRGNRLKALRIATQNGYVYIDLYRIESGRSQRYTFRLHRLVLWVFEGPRPAGASIHHKDYDRTNNALSNLEYTDKATNDADHQDPLWEEWIEHAPFDGEWEPDFEEWKSARLGLASVPF